MFDKLKNARAELERVADLPMVKLSGNAQALKNAAAAFDEITQALGIMAAIVLSVEEELDLVSLEEGDYDKLQELIRIGGATL